VPAADLVLGARLDGFAIRTIKNYIPNLKSVSGPLRYAEIKPASRSHVGFRLKDT
jgi:hypothetical protein